MTEGSSWSTTSKRQTTFGKYREVKSNFKRNDARIRKKITSKYGRKQKNRVSDIIHKATKKIASRKQRVFMEDISGIKRLYRTGNGQGRKFRGRMNSWSFYEFQRPVEYKSRWNGIPEDT